MIALYFKCDPEILHETTSDSRLGSKTERMYVLLIQMTRLPNSIVELQLSCLAFHSISSRCLFRIETIL